MKIINPTNPEKKRTIIEREIRTIMLVFWYLIFVMFFEKTFAKKIVRKNAQIPETIIAITIIKRSWAERLDMSC